MVATKDSHSLRANAHRVMTDFDPDATGATIVDLDRATGGEGLPIENFRRFIAGLFRSVGTGSVTSFAIVADTDDDLATTPTVVVQHAIGSAPNAVGDTIWLECDAEDIKEVLAGATHVGVRVNLVTATDECVVYFERADPYYPVRGLTTDYIS